MQIIWDPLARDNRAGAQNSQQITGPVSIILAVVYHILVWNPKHSADTSQTKWPTVIQLLFYFPQVLKSFYFDFCATGVVVFFFTFYYYKK